MVFQIGVLEHQPDGLIGKVADPLPTWETVTLENIAHKGEIEAVLMSSSIMPVNSTLCGSLTSQ